MFLAHLWIPGTKVKWSQACKSLLELQREEWWMFGCNVCTVYISPVCHESGGYLCGNEEQATVMEWQIQTSEPWQWNKTRRSDGVKTQEIHFFHSGFLWLGQLVIVESNTCAPSERAGESWNVLYGNECGPVVSQVITAQYCVSGHETERYPRAEPGLLSEPSSAHRPNYGQRSCSTQFGDWSQKRWPR